MAARSATASEPSDPAERLLAKLWTLDALLVAHGWPPMSPWWRAQLERFYRSGRKQFTLRVGRRGGKSSTLCRVLVIEALYGRHNIQPGDEGVIPIISTRLGEAGKRLATIEAILAILKVPTSVLGKNRTGIRISSQDGKPVAFELFAATVAGVSGFTGICALCDEVAKWKDEDTGSNPATEVMRSLRPTMATTKDTAKLFMVSSPFSTLDAHFEAMKEGDTIRQLVAEAPTWVANPTITEADTYELEPDEATRLREYGAIPMSGGESFFFDHGTVDAALLRVFDMRRARSTCGVDPAFRGDSAGACVGGRAPSPLIGSDVYGVRDLLELTPRPGAPLVPGAVVGSFAVLAKPYGVRELVTDFHYPESVREHAGRHKLVTVLGPQDKVETYTRVRVPLAQGLVSLGSHMLSPKLARQIKETMQKPTAAGSLSIFSPRRPGSHGDLASAWVLTMWRLGAGKLERTAEEVVASAGIACGNSRWTGVVENRRGFGAHRGGASRE